jgi:uncharacterized integral membrane protein
MRAVRIIFHLVMIVALIAAFSGQFDAPRSGSFMADQSYRLNLIIGLLAIWIVGALVLRFLGRAIGR